MKSPLDMTGPELVENWTRIHNRLSGLMRRCEIQQGIIDKQNAEIEELRRATDPLTQAQRLFEQEQSE